jgi:hypothetical protein
MGFTASKFDASLLVYKYRDRIAYLPLYVDDIILTASSRELLQLIMACLHYEFAMMDLGDLHHFLGISLTCDNFGCSCHNIRTPSTFSNELASPNVIPLPCPSMRGTSCPPP